MTKFVEEARKDLENTKCRSQRAKGITKYALELLDNYEETSEDQGRDARTIEELKAWLLNGAQNWFQYSNGGCSLIYNEDIVERLMPPSFAKKYNGGGNIDWINEQSIALAKASQKIVGIFKIWKVQA